MILFPRLRPEGTALFVCEGCHVAEWSAEAEPVCKVARCRSRPDGPPKLRPATKGEQEKAARSLQAA